MPDKRKVDMGIPGYLGTITISRNQNNELVVGINVAENTPDDKLVIILANTIQTLYQIGAEISKKAGIDFDQTVENLLTKQADPDDDTEEGDVIGRIN